MTMKSVSPVVSAIKPEDGSPVAGFVSKFGQEQYALGLETDCVWIHNMKTIFESQQQAVHQALSAYELTAKKWFSTSNPANFQDLHMDLMSCCLENLIRSCEQIATTGLQAHIEVMARFNHLLTGSSKEPARKDFE